jgi:hypothetical protein
LKTKANPENTVFSPSLVIHVGACIIEVRLVLSGRPSKPTPHPWLFVIQDGTDRAEDKQHLLSIPKGAPL